MYATVPKKGCFQRYLHILYWFPEISTHTQTHTSLTVRLISTNIGAHTANKDDSDHQGNRADLLYAISYFLFHILPLSGSSRLWLSISPIGSVLTSIFPSFPLTLPLALPISRPPFPSVSGHQAQIPSPHQRELIEILLEKVSEPSQQSQTWCKQGQRRKGNTYLYMHPHRHTGTCANKLVKGLGKVLELGFYCCLWWAVLFVFRTVNTSSTQALL